MIDTINYRLSDYRSDTDYREHVPYLLENPCISKRQCEIFYTGFLGNLKVNVSKNSIRVANSLCKWYLGDNLQTLNWESIKLANEKLSDTLHVNMQSADITRMDIGQNLPMNYKPKVYFDSLGQLSRYKRLEQPNGVCYRTNNMELIFYDKLVEYKKKCGKIPLNYSDSNLLRYELKLKGDLKRILKQSEVKVQSLSNINLYNQLVNLHSDMYYKVEKKKQLNLNIGGMKGVKGMYNSGVVLMLNTYGSNQLLKQIDNDFTIGKITYGERRDMKEKIKSIANAEDLFVDSPLIVELDNSIKLVTNSI